MNERDDLNQLLSAWIEDPYTPPAPRYLGQVLERTRRTRQLPAWASLERWNPMATDVTQPAAARPQRFALLLLIALLAVALAVGVAVVGSRLLRSTDPIPQGGSAVLVFASLADPSGAPAVDIYTVRADGTDLRRLTSGPGDKGAVAFSPDGRRIAYRLWHDGIESVVVMDAAGGNATTLASNTVSASYCSRGAIAWAPDGSSLIFPVSATCEVLTGPPQEFDLFIVAADGSTPATKLLAEGTEGVHATWSPDGTRIAFMGREVGQRAGYYVVDAGSGSAVSGGLTPRRIGTRAGDLENSNADIQWAPDGSRFAVISETSDLVTIGADGSAPRVLARQAYSPRWSPDGRRLAFHRQVDPSEFFADRPCTARIWVVDADGSNERRLEDLSDGCDAPPSWSPDGTRITGSLIASTVTAPALGPHLGVITVDGSSPTVILQDGPTVSWQPVAAPLPPAPSVPAP
jgi:Tol biopolymer transport system component